MEGAENKRKTCVLQITASQIDSTKEITATTFDHGWLEHMACCIFQLNGIYRTFLKSKHDSN